VAIWFGWTTREVSKPVAEAVAADAPVKRLAPEGVFFVLQRISAATDSGVVSIGPGTKVTLVRAGSPMRVTDGEHQYDVSSDQLTNDMAIAEQLVQAGQQAKASQEIAQKTQEGQQLPEPGRKPAAKETPPEKVTAKIPAKAPEREDPSLAERQRKSAEIRKKIKDINQAIEDYRPWRNRRGRIPIGEQHEHQRFIDNKRDEIRKLEKELADLWNQRKP